MPGSAKKFTKIFFVTDVHGAERTFRKFVNAGKIYKTDVVMLCGDLTGKMVIPIYDQNDGAYHCRLFSQDYVLRNAEEITKMEERIANVGFYAFRTTKDEMERIGCEKGRSEKIFKQLMMERLNSWLSFVKNHLKDTGIKCIISPGNDDYIDIDDLLNNDDFVINGDGRIVNIDDTHPMITVGHSNMTPWKCPRDISEEELGERIGKLADKVADMQNCIFNIHVPPIRSGIDSAAKLDTSVNPPKRIIEGGASAIDAVGSTAVRAAIEKYQPLLGLHGHIHESRGVAMMGRTLCVNPGSEYAEGVLRGVIVSISDGQVGSYQFTAG
jgi:hypothetical protein